MDFVETEDRNPKRTLGSAKSKPMSDSCEDHLPPAGIGRDYRAFYST